MTRSPSDANTAHTVSTTSSSLEVMHRKHTLGKAAPTTANARSVLSANKIETGSNKRKSGSMQIVQSQSTTWILSWHKSVRWLLRSKTYWWLVKLQSLTKSLRKYTRSENFDKLNHRLRNPEQILQRIQRIRRDDLFEKGSSLKRSKQNDILLYNSVTYFFTNNLS